MLALREIVRSCDVIPPLSISKLLGEFDLLNRDWPLAACISGDTGPAAGEPGLLQVSESGVAGGLCNGSTLICGLQQKIISVEIKQNKYIKQFFIT